MSKDDAIRELKVIRELMERPIRYSTMSGLSGVLAGLAALGGVITYVKAGAGLDPLSSFAAWLWMWGGVLLVASAATLILTRIRERAQDMPFWSSVKRRILMTVLPPFLAAVGLTLAITIRLWSNGGQEALQCRYVIAVIWMFAYGLAMWEIGRFSTIEVRVLGLMVLAGALTTAGCGAWCVDWAMAGTFGGLHVAYGIVVRARHGG